MIGYEESENCGRDGCDGIIETAEAINCSCHIHPPCSACTTPRNFCPVCGWEEKDDPLVVKEESTYHVLSGHVEYRKRVLDPTKIDYISGLHSSSSMIKRGVYPEGTTQQQVLEKVSGTFGGRFNHFGGGRFEFIAYTD